MALARLKHNLQRDMRLLSHILQRIHNISRKGIPHRILLLNPPALLPRPRSVKVDWIDALVGFGFLLLLALDAHALFLVHLWHATTASALAAEHLLHLRHHVGVGLLLLLLALLLLRLGPDLSLV